MKILLAHNIQKSAFVAESGSTTVGVDSMIGKLDFLATHKANFG